MSKVFAILALSLTFLTGAHVVHAEDALSVSITPPLFQLAVSPGESWSSAIKIVNNNNAPTTYYARVADFESRGEDGTSNIVPVVDPQQDNATYSLAGWMDISTAPITIFPGGSAQVPFSIHVPLNAEPGGHYGAILIGTQPPATQQAGSHVSVSSYVSSLIFVRIKGNAVEDGIIREFSTTESLYDTPNADFVLRFENRGNTHVKPEGIVSIHNMWGKERGKVLINQDTGNFGNVLPNSVRKFQFSWESESDPFDIGLYSANVTLSYGDEGKRNISAKTYFWVVPVVPVSIGIGSLIAFILMMTWLIRRYVRKALSIERQRTGSIGGTYTQENRAQPSVLDVEYSVATFVEPIKEGVIDLRSLTKKGGAAAPVSAAQLSSRHEQGYEAPAGFTFKMFINKYKLFILFISILIAGWLITSFFFTKVLVPQRHFQIKDVQIQIEAPETASTTGVLHQ